MQMLKALIVLGGYYVMAGSLVISLTVFSYLALHMEHIKLQAENDRLKKLITSGCRACWLEKDSSGFKKRRYFTNGYQDKRNGGTSGKSR